MEEGRLIVSTNQVDQKTGEDIMIKQNKVQKELTKIEDEKIKLFFDKNVDEEIPGVGALTGIPLRINEEEEQDCGEYEIWEMLQMKNAGRKDYHVENYNSKNVPVRFTWTNPLIEEKHLFTTVVMLKPKGIE